MTSLSDLELSRNLYKTPPQTVETLEADEVASNLSPAPSTAIASGNSVTDINTNAETINGSSITPGTIPQPVLDIANWGWTQSCAFVVFDADTVTWGAGTFTSADGTSVYSISAGTTGNMGASPAKTYVYLDINVSLTVYQISTTATNAIGIGKVLIAVCSAAVAPSVTATYILVQATQIVGDNIIANTVDAEKLNVAILSAITADLGSITAGSININNKSFIESTGEATFIGVSTLNMKSYTDFENSGRFVLTGADTPPTFGNNGMVVAPGVSSTKWSRALWYITNFVFANNPTFTCSVTCLGGFGTGDGTGFIGLGNMTMTGSGVTESGRNICGFEFKKTAGVTTLIAVQCDGSGSIDFSGTLATLVNGDSIDLLIKVTATGINYYTRKNAGSTSAPTTLSLHIPTGSETNICFESTNKGTTDDFQIQVQCAAYEH